MSLFDYLGQPAGQKLGKAVAQAATAQNIRIESREVSNKKYTGKVMMYPKSFLDSYFNTPILEL